LNVVLFSPRKVDDVRRLYDMMQQQRADLHGWWGKPLLELMQITSQLIETAPGRAYAGGHWNWGKDFDIKSGMHKKRSFLSLILLFFCFAQVHQIVLLVDVWEFVFERAEHRSQLSHHQLERRARSSLCGESRRPSCTVQRQIHHLSQWPGVAKKAIHVYSDRFFGEKKLPAPFVARSSEKVGHMVHEWTSAKGFFDMVELAGCYNAFNQNAESFHKWMANYVSGTLHKERKYLRVALSESEECRPTESTNLGFSQGAILSQSGFLDT